MEISVIIPCYNDGQFLPDALASVHLHEHPQAEVIVVDDGSDDPQTLRMLEGIASPQVTVRHIAHGGPAAARNEGIRLAKGKYILPLDVDDRIEPEYLDRAKAVLDENPSVGVVYCHADLFGGATGRWRLPDYSFDRMLVQSVVFITAMFRKTDWESVGGFQTDMRHGMEDYDFFIGLLALGREIRQLPEVYFHYRIREGSRTARYSADPEKIKEMYHTVYAHHEAFYERHAKRYAALLRDALIDEQAKRNHPYWHAALDRLRGVPVVRLLVKGVPTGR